ncbi:hypothetical protein BV22DRAFT_76114 [Leucogyrophana mollusca]|uniref:Uncharacterized protein n=1 Tax=Leucogyrophana mollusca TaxID=85980 RepID=A0ACB8BZK2_9AGAM|nr:hypothetical protein BV22DRAFT_76114 [Leucogyrophana mollusca]
MSTWQHPRLLFMTKCTTALYLVFFIGSLFWLLVDISRDNLDVASQLGVHSQHKHIHSCKLGHQHIRYRHGRHPAYAGVCPLQRVEACIGLPARVLFLPDSYGSGNNRHGNQRS